MRPSRFAANDGATKVQFLLAPDGVIVWPIDTLYTTMIHSKTVNMSPRG